MSRVARSVASIWHRRRGSAGALNVTMRTQKPPRALAGAPSLGGRPLPRGPGTGGVPGKRSGGHRRIPPERQCGGRLESGRRRTRRHGDHRHQQARSDQESPYRGAGRSVRFRDRDRGPAFAGEPEVEPACGSTASSRCCGSLSAPSTDLGRTEWRFERHLCLVRADRAEVSVSRRARYRACAHPKRRAPRLGNRSVRRRGERRCRRLSTRTIRIVVPYTTGGGTDVMARVIAADLSKMLGQSAHRRKQAGRGWCDRHRRGGQGPTVLIHDRPHFERSTRSIPPCIATCRSTQ